MANISNAAETALVDANNSSGRVHPSAGQEVIRELRAAGLIGDGNGMTRSGRIARDRIMSARLDASF